uniref:C-type lectin domain-containing protein n=1 Tax=Oryzias latipes TaxID=8090 RepID=A0A3P9KWX7_ORYLA
MKVLMIFTHRVYDALLGTRVQHALLEHKQKLFLKWSLECALLRDRGIRPIMNICQTCPKDWIQFQESCYFFYNLNSPWKTWNLSRQFCQSMKSDLVVISSLEEQVCYKMLN